MQEIKFLDWNVNGIRAGIKKGLWEKLGAEKPDFFAIQEIKCQGDTMEEIFGDLTNPIASLYLPFYNFATSRKGYSGTAIFVKREIIDSGFVKIQGKPFYNLNIEKFDCEGRLTGLFFEIGGVKIFLLNGYYPQGGRDGRIPYKIEFYSEVKKICQKQIANGFKLILCGDLNTTLQDIDLARPKENRKTTGCLPEERIAMNWLIGDGFFDPKLIQTRDLENEKESENLDLIDTFRHFYPQKEGEYTYWDQITRARDRNVGWRIDYWLVSKELLENLVSTTNRQEIMGSDHCPVEMIMKF